MTTTDLPAATRRSWHRFLETYEPLRGELYRYCRYLTRSPWDAEDLVQDALARAFVTLAQLGTEPPNPRAWLFRVASNLWIDQLRRRRELPLTDAAEVPAGPDVAAPDARATREAAGTLLVKLAPQERAAVVLKDVFELSLEEVAEVLGTTVGGIKAALHRGRGKLAGEAAPAIESAPVPGALDAFVTAFNAGDLDGLTALLLDTAVVEVVGATTQYGPEAARRTVLFGMLFGVRRLAAADPTTGIDARFSLNVLPELPRVEARLHRGRWILVHWYRHTDGDHVRAFTLLELIGDRVARLQNYFYNSEFLIDLAGELGVPVRVNGQRWWRAEASSFAMPAACARPASSSVASYANVHGLRMYYEVHGHGRPLVLIHGGGSTIQTSFGAILPRLARSHRVIAVEEQGHGHTADLDRALSFEQMADDTAALVEQLGIRDADVLGFSNGGMTALKLALRHPALVHRLVICSGFYARGGLIPALRAAFEQQPDPDKMPTPLRDAYLAAAPHPDLQRFVTKTVAMMRSFPDLSDDALRTIVAPTLVMAGDHDVILPDHAVQLARLVAHGQLAIFPDSQHGTYIGAAEVPADPQLQGLGVAMIERFLSE